MNDWRDDGMAAHQLELEQQEQHAAFWCPYCGTVYTLDQANSDTGSDIVCCGEMHCEPYTLELEQLQ